MSIIVQDLASEQGCGQDGFCLAASNSKWYESLKHFGSCKRLLELLTKDPTLIHGLEEEDMSVLHKGLQHGCVALVRFVLVDVFDDSGHCKCGRHGAGASALTRKQFLQKTCLYGSTAVNMAVVSGSPKMVVLLEWAIKMCRRLSEQSAKEGASWNNKYYYKNMTTIHSSYLKKGGEEETHLESIIDKDIDFPVPNVKDDDLSILYSSTSEVKSKIIFVIKEVLENLDDENMEWMDMVKEWFAKDVDFEFVLLAHVFLQFLYIIEGIHCDHGFLHFEEMSRT